jgi:hypothetical protein
MRGRGSVVEFSPGIYTLTTPAEYDAKTGLLVDEIPNDPELFIL